MGFVTYFGIVSLYAEPTSVQMGWYNGSGAVTRQDRKWIRKCRRRGYNPSMGPEEVEDLLGPHLCGESPHCSWTVRSLFDEGVHVHKFEAYAQSDTGQLLRRLSPWFIWHLANGRCVESLRDPTGFAATPDDFVPL
jgi:hypothetical protein